MDTSNGHLVTNMLSVDESLQPKYTPVPKHLEEYAAFALHGRQETTIDLARDSELARWASGVRKRNRAKAKMAKQSRKANRK